MLSENYQIIKQNIDEAAKISGRVGDDITLIAVSKMIPVERINEAASLGIENFGENKVQEMLKKTDQINRPVNWHMIGHLQTNKVKQIVDKVTLIHSVDSIRLGEEINLRAKQKEIIIKCLIEVNIAKEAAKNGIFPENTLKLAEELSKLPNLIISGLMCIAPFVEKGENNRFYFSAMRDLYIDIESKISDNVNMCFLSMGMTNDYRVAIEEGANIVRIGTGLFGIR